MFPTVTARVTFNSFEWKDDLPDSLFYIPVDYHEDPKRFPDLWLYFEIYFIHILTSLRQIHQAPDDGEQESYVGMEIPMTNLGNSCGEMTLLF